MGEPLTLTEFFGLFHKTYEDAIGFLGEADSQEYLALVLFLVDHHPPH